MGSIVASLASHHDRPFHAIEGIEWPFLILFFVLAGASAHVEALGLRDGQTQRVPGPLSARPGTATQQWPGRHVLQVALGLRGCRAHVAAAPVLRS